MYPTLVLTSGSSNLHLPGAGITGLCHRAGSTTFPVCSLCSPPGYLHQTQEPGRLGRLRPSLVRPGPPDSSQAPVAVVAGRSLQAPGWRERAVRSPRTMADLTVCAFLTKVLCAHGGRMFLQDLRGHVELSEAKLRAVLRRAGPERFLLQEVELRDGPWDPEAEVAVGAGSGGGATACRVVAVSSARLCARYQRGECQACDQLHLCRRHMLGKCPHRDCW